MVQNYKTGCPKTDGICDVYLTWFQYDRLKRRNEELSERADTAEFQVGTISQEYRKLLQQKEVGQ